MTKRFALALITCLTLAVLVLPASAAINVIPAGATVFIGEDNLDVTAGCGTVNPTTIAWYDPGTIAGVDQPAKTLSINPAKLYVAPTDFVGRTGFWYVFGQNVPAFSVADPSIDIKAWDNTAKKDVTGKSVPGGNILNFRIETNLNSITTRDPAAPGVVTIKVKTSDGTVYTALFWDTWKSKALTGVKVDAQPYYWVEQNNVTVGWNTAALDQQGNRMYKAGVYTITAECNANGMKDNYKAPDGSDYTGKTISATRTVTIASDTVKIEASKDTVVRGNPFSVTITGRPNTAYYVWVRGTGQMSGLVEDQPPLMAQDQDNVKNDPMGGPYTIGAYQYQGGGGSTIRNDTPKAPSDGVLYYASVMLSNSGTRTVGFQTSKDTKDKKYTLRVEQQFGDQYKSD